MFISKYLSGTSSFFNYQIFEMHILVLNQLIIINNMIIFLK